MSEQTITLRIPADLYEHLQRHAQAGGRNVQDEITETLRTTLPGPDQLPAYLVEAMTPLSFLSDEELWHAARSQLSAEESDEIETLQRKRGLIGLSEAESQILDGLLRRSERVMLTRAQAAKLLQKLGHDVSVLLRAS